MLDLVNEEIRDTLGDYLYNNELSVNTIKHFTIDFANIIQLFESKDNAKDTLEVIVHLYSIMNNKEEVLDDLLIYLNLNKNKRQQFSRIVNQTVSYIEANKITTDCNVIIPIGWYDDYTMVIVYD